MSGLTVIIPFRAGTEIELFEETLASVLEFRPDGLEILVVNAGGYSDSYSIEEEGVHFLPAEEAASLTQCVNLGIEAAKTPYIQTLLCGVTVHEGWAEVPLSYFENPAIGVVAPQVIRRGESLSAGRDSAEGGAAENRSEEAQERVLTGWRYHRDGRLERLESVSSSEVSVQNAPTQYSAFYRREPLADLEGLEGAYPLDFAQVDASLLLGALGFKTIFDSTSALDASDCPEEEPDQEALWTYSETLYRRWFDLGDAAKNRMRYCRRTIVEWFRSLFNGNGPKQSSAKACGEKLADSAKKMSKIDSAREKMVQRISRFSNTQATDNPQS